MAQVVMEMTALAVYGSELCSACDRTFRRGELMSAVEADDGAKLGWFCRECLAEWAAACVPSAHEGLGLGSPIPPFRREDEITFEEFPIYPDYPKPDEDSVGGNAKGKEGGRQCEDLK